MSQTIKYRSTTCSTTAFASPRIVPMAIVSALALLLAACTTAPKPLRGEFASISPQQASESGGSGDLVRWGGSILDVETDGERSCFVMLGRPLGDSSRPREGDVSVGRFLACRAGFYDPAIFAKDREITVIGRVTDFQNRPVGEYNYRYPTLDAEVIYLWPERNDNQLVYVGALGWYPSPYGFGGYRVHHYVPVHRVNSNSGGRGGKPNSTGKR